MLCLCMGITNEATGKYVQIAKQRFPDWGIVAWLFWDCGGTGGKLVGKQVGKQLIYMTFLAVVKEFDFDEMESNGIDLMLMN